MSDPDQLDDEVIDVSAPEPTIRSITIGLDDVLSLVCCAEDYGFNDDVLMYTFAKWVGTLTNEDMETFLHEEFLSDEAAACGYGQEDYDEGKERMIEFQKRCAYTNKSTPE